MAIRVEVNCQTGEVQTIPLTQAELDAAAAAKAAEDAFNAPDNVAARAIDATDRLWFEVTFNLWNRVRVLEGGAAISRAAYRNALVALYKTLL